MMMMMYGWYSSGYIPSGTVSFPTVKLLPRVTCTYCNSSGEGQRWNSDKHMMETITDGCSYCKGERVKE